jgi:general secretion pathway protein K
MIGIEPAAACPARRTGERGFIVVAVLWILATLSALVLIYLIYVTDTAVIVAGSTDRVQNEALMTGAVELAASQLANSPDTDRPTHGKLDTRLGAGRIAVAYRSEDARVDLNTASKELLSGLIGGFGVGKNEADDYASHIVAWRTETKPGADDSESSLYAAMGLGYTPRHAPFPSTEELWLVAGIPPALIARLLPFVTVYSNLPTVNIVDAAPEVIAAMPGMTPDKMQAVLAARDTPGLDAKTVAAMAGISNAAAEPSKTYRLNVNVASGTGKRSAAEIVILLLDDGDEPYRILSWRDEIDSDAETRRASLQ